MSSKPLVVATVAALLLGGCAPANASKDDRIEVVASTPIIADLVRNVAGQDASVTSLVPTGADPHSYEPPLRAVRDVAWADLAFENGLLLESGAIRHTMRANLREGVPLISLGDKAPAYGGRHIRLVEDFALSTVWLGFRSDRLPGPWQIRATSMEGPGRLAAFTTGTFGEGRPYITSADGFGSADAVALPPDAHTHMSWAFSEAGTYTLNLVQEPHSGNQESLAGQQGASKGEGVPDSNGSETQTDEYEPRPISQTPSANSSNATSETQTAEEQQAATSKAPSAAPKDEVAIRFAVGVEPDTGLVHLDAGHVDITATPQGIRLLADEDGKSVYYDPQDVQIVVPNRTLAKVPQGNWAFLGKPGEDTWILAQAVLGEHIHGEIDPHLWHDVNNAIAYVDVIAEELAKADPERAQAYATRAKKFKAELRQLDQWTAAVLASIPAQNRKLVTAHDAFGYLASRYGLEVAGFVAPNPSIEPSSRDMAILSRQLRDLHVPAVFENPASAAHQAELQSAAESAGVRLCSIYADSLTQQTPTYVSLVEANVTSLKACLDPTSQGAWPRASQPVLKGI
ncbi:metal ABC transporter solute-binding protein, Zn/Mn family [Actinomyces sp.]|uniref:metal ABC transporter solute-binding protein, Zn/Mn family n=1 Tax=Actinomyces sp. TaxID=29317 RepID=UPI00290F6DD4|nr:zinc ABC transporter substrate-binding protein [Actinomyces sp.]MDU7239858.1 zinc ABC transporter substrate-binding protein [Actinomyces sp.]